MAVGNIGGINVKVTADIAGFHAAMNRVGAKVSSTASKVRESSQVYQRWATVGAAAALAVGTAMIKSQMQQLDALAKTSDALGVQQKQLQALQHVAELTGTGAAQLSVNLERMQRRIGEVARKGGQAEAALTEIGIAAKDMINLPADEQLVRISQAMQGVDNASIKASIAMDLFGRDGVRMLKMMEQLGKDGLAPTVADLEAMGVALSRLDTAKVEQANDAMFRSSQVTSGLLNKVAVKLSPIIEGIANSFTDAAKESGGFGDSIDSVFSKALTVVGVFADGLHGIQIIFKGLEVAARSIGVVFWEVFRVMTVGMEQFINTAINSVNSMIESINSIGLVTLPTLGKFSSSAAAMFTDISTKAKEGVLDALSEMNNMALEPLPSEQIDAFVAKAQEASQAMAEAATAGSGGGTSTVGLTEEERKSLEERLETIRTSLMTEAELKQAAFQADVEALQLKLQTDAEFQAEHDQLLRERAMQHGQEMTDIEKKASDARLAVIESERQSKLSAYQSMFSGLASLMNTNSKALFNIGKAAALANVGINTWESASEAYAGGLKVSGGNPVVGAAFAATAVAAGLAQAANIAKQKIGGASASGASQSFSGGMPVTNTGQQQQTQNVDVYLSGDNFSRGGIAGLIGTINDYIGDGGTKIRVN